MRPHNIFLEIALADWRWYFDYQRQAIREFVSSKFHSFVSYILLKVAKYKTEKAMHSSLAQKHVDYEVDFVDCQRLERILEKLSLSQEILMAMEQIAYTLQSLAEGGKTPNNHDQELVARDLHELLLHINKIRGFKRTASALKSRVERTSILVS